MGGEFIPIKALELNKWYNIEVLQIKGRIEINIDDTQVLAVDMNDLASFIEQSLAGTDETDETAAQAASLINTIQKLLGTLKNSFKNMKLYKGSDEVDLDLSGSRFVEPDASFEYFRYSNGYGPVWSG